MQITIDDLRFDPATGEDRKQRILHHTVQSLERRVYAHCGQADFDLPLGDLAIDVQLNLEELSDAEAGGAIAARLFELIRDRLPVRGFSPQVQAFIDRATPFGAGEDIPGGAGGVNTRGQAGRFLRSSHINSDELAAFSHYTMGVSQQFDLGAAQQIPQQLDGFVQLGDDLRTTDTVFASDEHTGSAGVVRMGDLNGRPVAVKTIHPMWGATAAPGELDEHILQEAQASWLFDQIGVGPTFHGVHWDDDDNRWAVVTDVAQGDFPGEMSGHVGMNTLMDLENIFWRLSQIGINGLGDFQYFVNDRGGVILIDPESPFGSMGKPLSSWDKPSHVEGSQHNGERVRLLRDVDPHEAIRYLNWFYGYHLDGWKGLCRTMVQKLQQDRNCFAPVVIQYLKDTRNDWAA